MRKDENFEKSEIMGDCNDSVTSLFLQSIGDEISTAFKRILSELANAVQIYKSENAELKQIAMAANKEVIALRNKQEEQSRKYFVLLDNFNNQAKIIAELKTENLALIGYVEILDTRRDSMTMGSKESCDTITDIKES